MMNEKDRTEHLKYKRRKAARRKKRKVKIGHKAVLMAVILICAGIVIKTNIAQFNLFLSGESMSGERLDKKEKAMYHKIMKHKADYPELLIEAIEGNTELTEFVYHYKDREEYQNKKVSVKEEIKKGEIPLLMQWDLRWGYNKYGNDMIGISGCGPTCLSMVIIGLTQNTKYTPDKVAKYSMKHGYVIDGSTAWSLMYEGAQHFGIMGEEIGLDKNQVESYLENGNPIICSMRPGDFTTKGHFIVLSGIKEGKIVVNDPNSKIRSEKLWDFDKIQDQIKNLWVFSKAD